MSRLVDRFKELRSEGRSGLVTFITAGDPNEKVSAEILAGLPSNGADIIELGMPFTDPMADGPSIELASVRALAAGQTTAKTLSMVSEFRRQNTVTPIVLMGYYNPILQYGLSEFAEDAAEAGVDGLIIVDLPPEEEKEFSIFCDAFGVDIVRLIAPTSTDSRITTLVKDAAGFVYYVSVRGITGTTAATANDIAQNVARIRKQTDLPIAVGFGIKTPKQAAEVATIADAAVVGSAIVEKISARINGDGQAAPDLVSRTLDFVAELGGAIRSIPKHDAQ